MPTADLPIPDRLAAGAAVAEPRADGLDAARPSAARAWLRFLGSELRLILSRRRNQAGLAVLAAVPILISVAVKVSAPERQGDGANFLAQIVGNGYFVALAALLIEIGLFLPLAMAMLCGDSVAGEAQQGTLRGLLVVPVVRTRLLATKYVSLVLGGIIAVVVVVATGLVVGSILFGLHPVPTLSGTTLSLGAGLGRLAIAAFYVAGFLAALGALGLFVSTLTEQPLGATVAIALVSTLMWIAEAIPQLDWLHPWLLVDQQMAFADVLRDPVWWPNMRVGLLTDLAYIVVFLLAAWARFADKDVSG
jgi:ABC-2 type transport system permease protein